VGLAVGVGIGAGVGVGRRRRGSRRRCCVGVGVAVGSAVAVARAWRWILTCYKGQAHGQDCSSRPLCSQIGHHLRSLLVAPSRNDAPFGARCCDSGSIAGARRGDRELSGYLLTLP